MFRKYRNSSSSSPHLQRQRVVHRFRRYRKPSSISPSHFVSTLRSAFQRYRRLSSNSPSKCLTNLFSPLLRHRKSSRNAERTTKRSTFRLLLKVPEVFESACYYIYAFRHRHLRIKCTVTGVMAKRDRLQRSSVWATFFRRHIPVLWYNGPVHQSINRKGKRCFLTCLALCSDRF